VLLRIYKMRKISVVFGEFCIFFYFTEKLIYRKFGFPASDIKVWSAKYWMNFIVGGGICNCLLINNLSFLTNLPKCVQSCLNFLDEKAII